MQASGVLGRRVVAAIVDACVVVVIVALVGGVFGNDTAADVPVSARFGTLDRLLIIGLVFAYFWGAETTWAQTIGKRVMKLRVVRTDGTRAESGPVALRNVIRIVDFLPFFYIVGAISIVATGERRLRLGDLAAKTTVIAADAPPPPPPPPPPEDEDVLAQVLR